MKEFVPDYQNILDAASNKRPKRYPFYDHLIDDCMMEKLMGKKFNYGETRNDRSEYIKDFCNFFKQFGYDTVMFERCIPSVIEGSGALGSEQAGFMQTKEDFNNFDWNEIPDKFMNKHKMDFELLREHMPQGMKAVGIVGTGPFEMIHDLVGYRELCVMLYDDHDLFEMILKKINIITCEIWDRVLKLYGDVVCVSRFGDDLGFNTQPLIPPKEIINHIVPIYKNVVDISHKYNKPFLLHSCGCIFDVMDSIIGAGIDAKHSNEDNIAPFYTWVEKYGDKIGNFGGVDVDMLCRASKAELKEYIVEMMAKCEGHGGIAYGTGNSIPRYVPIENYLNMLEIYGEEREKYIK